MIMPRNYFPICKVWSTASQPFPNFPKLESPHSLAREALYPSLVAIASVVLFVVLVGWC